MRNCPIRTSEFPVAKFPRDNFHANIDRPWKRSITRGSIGARGPARARSFATGSGRDELLCKKFPFDAKQVGYTCREKEIEAHRGNKTPILRHPSRATRAVGGVREAVGHSMSADVRGPRGQRLIAGCKPARDRR